MLSRRQPIQRRLIRAYGVFSGLLLLVIWGGSLAYFYYYERAEQLQVLRTHAAMLATQTSAAVLFDDKSAMGEDLATLRHVANLRWAVVVEGLAATAGMVTFPQRLAAYGSPPEDLSRYLEGFRPGMDVLEGSDEVTVRQAIVVNGSHRADLLINLDMSHERENFLEVVATSLVANLVILGAATVFFSRIVLAVAQPMGALVRLADRTAREGIRDERVAVDGDDEIGRLGTAFNGMLDNLALREEELARSRDELRALSQRLQQVREEERTRISHEIHDELGQRMTALKFEVARSCDEETRSRLGAMIDDTLKVVRSISWELRPSLLDSVGLEAAIEWLARDFQLRMGIRCGVEVPTTALGLDSEQATDIFRVCQELLTNIARHAHASRADVALVLVDGHVKLEVRDNGVGMPPDGIAAGSLGLVGIRERAGRWGGHVEFSAGDAGEGTVVSVYMPRATASEAD